jgi:DNA-binding XRE family transcriptional regulator
MPNIATVFKSEIARLARKQVREECEALKKTSAAQRAEVVQLKRRVAALEKLVKGLTKPGRAPTVGAVSREAEGVSGARFSPQGLASNRARLGLSAADFGLLVGASGQSIYAWEAGKSKPRPAAIAAVAALRGLGKRDVARRLASLHQS